MKFRFLLLFILMISSSLLFAQNKEEKSLLKELDSATSPKGKIQIYLKLSNAIVYENLDKAYQYAQEGLKLSQQLKDKKLLAQSYSTLAFCKYSHSQYKEALAFLEKDYQLYTAIKDTLNMIESLDYQSMAYSYLGDNNKAIPLAEKALQMANKIDDKTQISIILNGLGMIYYRTSDYQKALQLLEKAYDLDTTHQTFNTESTLNSIAIIHSMNGEFDKAMSYFRGLLEETKNGDDVQDYGLALENLGGVHKTMGTYDSALIYFMEYLSIKKNYDNDFDLAWAYSQIAEIQLELGSLKEAYNNGNQAVKLFEKVGVVVYLTDGLITLSRILIQQNRLDEARITMTRAVKLANKQGNKRQIGILYNLSGLISLQEGHEQLALSLHQDAQLIFDNIGIKAELARSLYYIANAEYQLEQYESALEIGKQSLAIIENINYNSFLDELYNLLTKCSSKQGDYEIAFQYLSALKALEDSVLNVVKTERLVELQTELYVSEKDAENEKLKITQSQNKVTIQRRTIIGSILGFILLILGGIAYFLFQTNNRRKEYNNELEKEVANQTLQLKEANQELVDTNLELERFAYIASHDLKEPLRNITSFSALLKRKIEHHLTDVTKSYFDFIIDGTKQMNALIVDVLEFSRLNEAIIEKQEVSSEEVVNSIISTLEQTIQDKNAKIILHEMPTIQADPIKIYSVFKNLIENGIKYNNNETPTIEILGIEQENNFLFEIKDNGIGISDVYKNSIFEMFKRLHNRKEFEGTGIGLAFVKKVVIQHGGKIWVESQEGQGSIFKFTLPK